MTAPIALADRPTRKNLVRKARPVVQPAPANFVLIAFTFLLSRTAVHLFSGDLS